MPDTIPIPPPTPFKGRLFYSLNNFAFDGSVFKRERVNSPFESDRRAGGSLTGVAVDGGYKYFILFLFISLTTFAQKADSTKQLAEVVVRGFETERKLSETAASVNVLTIKDLQRFENTSLVPVFNTLPGVRM